VSGHGHCITPNGKTPLVPGQVFVIPEESQHSFHTAGEALRVIAYHPESDFGPTDETHPMVNKTILSDS
jgi:mannose-6-phosphate isomerase-like protein (cupin superfamily)